MNKFLVFLNVLPFSLRAFFTFLVVLTHGVGGQALRPGEAEPIPNAQWANWPS